MKSHGVIVVHPGSYLRVDNNNMRRVFKSTIGTAIGDKSKEDLYIMVFLENELVFVPKNIVERNLIITEN